MEKQPSPHTPASIARNISIGVITPVLAATIIYFLGFNRNDNADFKKKKDASVRTWAALEQNKDIFSAVMQRMDTATDIEATRKGINHEIDVTVDNMDNIKKEPNADQRVYSSIDIATTQMKDIKLLMNKFLDDMAAFAAKNPTEDEGKAFVTELAVGFRKDMARVKQRDSIRLAVFYEGLNKEYGITHSKQ